MTTGSLKQIIFKITGVQLKGDAYISQAFTRSSVSGCENNEIFESFGDAILSFYVMQLIHERFGFFRTEDNVGFQGENGYALKGIRNEAELDTVKKKLVSNETLAAQIDKWGLSQYLIMGKSDKNNHIENQTKIKADLFEAIIGAIAVTYNFNSEMLKNVVKRMLPIDEVFNEIAENTKQKVPFSIDNSITVLKELAEQGIISEPIYSFFGPEQLGYYKNGEPKWSCRCIIQKIGFIDVVLANSKKTAKRIVSYRALCKYFEISDEITKYLPFNDNHIIEKNGEYIIIEEDYS